MTASELRRTRAVSDDGYWMAQLCAPPLYRETFWWVGETHARWDEPTIGNRIPDSGQDAGEVLAAWEKENGAR